MAATAISVQRRYGSLLGLYLLAHSFTRAFRWLAMLGERDLIESLLLAKFLGA